MRRLAFPLLVLAALTAVTAAQYGGVSWRNFGGVDEWLFPSLNSRAILSFPHTNRPLTMLWPLPAFAVTPYRFEGYLLVHLGYLAVLGWLTWLLARRLAPGLPGLAFTAGVLAVGWAPLDMGRLAVVQTSVAMGVTAATFLAIVLLVESWRRDSPALLVAAAAAAFAVVRSYEAPLGLLFGAPLLLPLLPGTAPRPRRRLLLWIGAWEVVVAVLAGMAAAPLLRGVSGALYQSNVMRPDPSPLRYLARIGRQYLWHLGPLVPAHPAELVHPRTALTVLVFLAGGLACGSHRAHAPGLRQLVRLAVLGLVLAGMAYSVLALSPATDGPTRMQFLSAPGIALFLSAAIAVVASLLPSPGLRPAAALLAAALVLAVGAGHTQAMQREWDRISFYPRQRDCLVSLVRQAPLLRPGSLLLLIDEDGTWPWTLTFHHAARLVYGDAVTAHALGSDQLLYTAAMDGAGVHVRPWPVIQGPWREHPSDHRYDQVVVFRLSGGVVSLLDAWPRPRLPPLPGDARYAPAEAITDGPPPASRRVLD